MRTANGFFAAAAAVAVLAGASPAARAALDMTSIGGSGVTSSIGNYSLISNVFSFSLTNTAYDGTITAIGFDLPGVNNTYSLLSRTHRDFDLKNDLNAQAGAQNYASKFEFALVTGSNFGGGKVADGIDAGRTGTFRIIGDFGKLSAEQIAQGSYARFQGIGKKDNSDVTRVTGIIPEPGTFALVAAGLLPLAAGVTRRRRTRA